MPFKQHGREYDLVVFGASGYTGKLTAQYITTHLPTDLKWALAGRSTEKLEQVAATCKALNADRRQPAIEPYLLDEASLLTLARKTYILITVVGPYGKYGEPAVRACATAGTHYLDATGETPFVARMIRNHQSTAEATGAVLIPQCGLESSLTDTMVWLMAARMRADEQTFGSAPKLGDVVVSVRTLDSRPSGGTLASALGILDNFSFAEMRAWGNRFFLLPSSGPQPFAPRSEPRPAPYSGWLLRRLTGLTRVPGLPLQTSSISASMDVPIVNRTWALLAQEPARRAEAYGPDFAFTMSMRAGGWLRGMLFHYGLLVAGLLLATPLRHLVKRFVTQPGLGTDEELAKQEYVEFEGVAKPAGGDGGGKAVFCRAWFRGSMYYLTGVTLSSAALTLLEDDIGNSKGGVFTPGFLGQGLINRMEQGGFHFETKVIDV